MYKAPENNGQLRHYSKLNWLKCIWRALFFFFCLPVFSANHFLLRPSPSWAVHFQVTAFLSVLRVWKTMWQKIRSAFNPFLTNGYIQIMQLFTGKRYRMWMQSTSHILQLVFKLFIPEGCEKYKLTFYHKDNTMIISLSVIVLTLPLSCCFPASIFPSLQTSVHRPQEHPIKKNKHSVNINMTAENKQTK